MSKGRKLLTQEEDCHHAWHTWKPQKCFRFAELCSPSSRTKLWGGKVCSCLLLCLFCGAAIGVLSPPSHEDLNLPERRGAQIDCCLWLTGCIWSHSFRTSQRLTIDRYSFLRGIPFPLNPVLLSHGPNCIRVNTHTHTHAHLYTLTYPLDVAGRYAHFVPWGLAR